MKNENTLRARLERLKRERDLDNATAAHWNRMHPDEKPIPESDPDVDAVIDATEAKLNSGRFPS